MFHLKIKTKSGKTLFSIGKEPSLVSTEEEMRELRKQHEKEFRAQLEKDRMDIALGKPSSKEGREIYYQRLGVLNLPLVLVLNVWGWVMGNQVWYSDKGVRYEGSQIDVGM